MNSRGAICRRAKNPQRFLKIALDDSGHADVDLNDVIQRRNWIQPARRLEAFEGGVSIAAIAGEISNEAADEPCTGAPRIDGGRAIRQSGRAGKAVFEIDKGVRGLRQDRSVIGSGFHSPLG